MTGKPTTEDAVIEPANSPTLDSDDSEAAAAHASQLVSQPSRLGRFVLLRELGSGGMGTVFAAYDEQLDRKVALKLLRKASAGTEVQRLRTLQEARAAARISHPNSIAIYDVGEIDGHIHIAMEYVDGGTLLAWQTTGEHSWREILEMYLQVGEALQAAHDADVVHRDFKPDNVLIGADARPRVVDFGLARVGWSDGTDEPAGADATKGDIGDRERITRPGTIFGTPGYMSPEQHRGDNIDSRSDQWSFCAALYEALYGYLPFSGSTIQEHARSVHGPPSLPPAGTKVPDELRLALLRGLAAEPSLRFPSMAELLAHLGQELRGDAAAGRVSRRRFSRSLLIAGLVALAANQAHHSQLSLVPGGRGIVWTGIIIVVVLGGLWRRQTFLSNRFHRDVWILILVALVLLLMQRLIAIKLGMPTQWVFPFQMVAMASIAAIVATTLMRELFFLPALPLLACLLSLTTTIPQRVLLLVHPLCVFCLALAWDRAAQNPSRRIGEADGGASSTGRFRRVPYSLQ